jgi:hypothetical protein
VTRDGGTAPQATTTREGDYGPRATIPRSDDAFAQLLDEHDIGQRDIEQAIAEGYGDQPLRCPRCGTELDGPSPEQDRAHNEADAL